MRNWLIDIAAMVIWGAGVALILGHADESTGAVLIPVFIALCAALGLVSGRYRILLSTAAIIVLGLVAGLIFGSGDDCRPSEGCEDDLAPAFVIIFFAAWFAAVEAMIAIGVAIRQRFGPG
jgi:hypothetical protein